LILNSVIFRYVGESERNVRAVFARARSYQPCIVFFDEVLFPAFSTESRFTYDAG
jgi:SpoVK/Ycf46/Vps4 family AAA+-type ATPase